MAVTISALLLFSMATATAQTETVKPKVGAKKKLEIATFAGGCFWCTEAVFQHINGVTSVKSGYIGGHTKNPTYKDICTGTTGHAEAIQITYDPTKVKYERLLEIHFKTHDPTTLNRQGNDVGTQYRSSIFFHSNEQKEIAARVKAGLDKSKAFDRPIVTEIVKASQFYDAEAHHQNYFAQNPNQGYCSVMIPPKLAKLEKYFKDDLKKTPAK
jgi:peptide-methionine (S)-S-oxide reductase